MIALKSQLSLYNYLKLSISLLTAYISWNGDLIILKWSLVRNLEIYQWQQSVQFSHLTRTPAYISQVSINHSASVQTLSLFVSNYSYRRFFVNHVLSVLSHTKWYRDVTVSICCKPSLSDRLNILTTSLPWPLQYFDHLLTTTTSVLRPPLYNYHLYI